MTMKNRSFKYFAADDKLAANDVFVDHGVVIQSTNFGNVLHSHEFFELEFICKGSTKHRINGQEKVVERGYAVLIKPNDFHEWSVSKEPITLYTVKFFDRKLSGGVASDLMRYNGIIESFMSEEEVENFMFLLNLLYEETRSEEKSEAAVRSLLNLIVINLLRCANHEKALDADDDSDSLFRKIFGYVEKNYLDPDFSLTDVSSYVNRTVSYVCQVFKNNVGTSFNKYVKQRRLNYSLSLLSEKTFSISEIAKMSGFNTASYYISVFRKFYGLTPKQYIERRTLDAKCDEVEK